MQVTILAIKWTKSRARDTYGYNIVTLTDTNTGKKHRTTGCGYDMVGTVVGNWLTSVFQDELKAADISKLYGAMVLSDGSIYIDGGCGDESVTSIAKAINVALTKKYINRELIFIAIQKE